MALSDLLNVNILRMDTVIEGISRGDGGHERDEVIVTTTLHLAGDIDPAQEVTILLPFSTEAQRRPLLRWIDDDPQEDAVRFDNVERSDLDQAVADALADVEDADRKERERLAKAILAAKKGNSRAVITVKPGQRVLRYSYSLSAERTAERRFSFEVLGPLASFVLQAGGSLSTIVILPWRTSLVEAHAWIDPETKTNEVPMQPQQTLGDRVGLGWAYTNDPLFAVVYSY